MSQQIANALRAAILRGQLGPGDRLPSQNDLVGRYGVARETVKAALRVLDREQLIISRQGSGSYVRSRRSTTPDVTDFLAGAYDRPRVTIDYAGWRGETLSRTFPDSIPALRRNAGTVRSLRLRLLLTDPRVPAGLPVPIDPDVDPETVRDGLIRLTDEAVGRIRRTAEEIVASGLIGEVDVQVRVHGLGPVIKAYLINDERGLIGFYPVTEHAMAVADRDVALHHPSGWEAAVFDDTDAEQQPTFAAQARSWFSSVWSTIGRPYS